MSKNLSLILTALVSVLTIGSIFTHLEGEEFEYIWEPSKSGNKVRLPLLEAEPDFFNLEFPCDLARSEPNWILDSQGGSALQIQLFPDKINIVLENKDFKMKNFTIPREPLSGMNCSENLSFDRGSRNIEYLPINNPKNRSIGEDFQFPIKSWMQWNDEISNASVKITIKTRPDLNITNSRVKNAMNYAWLTITFLMTFISIKNIKWKTFRIQRSETVSLLSVLALGVIGVPKYDDGWYLLTATALNNDNVYTNYAYPIAPPNGFLHTKLLSFFTGENPIVLFTRIPGMISAFIIWTIINRVILPWISSQNDSKIPKHVYWSSWLAFTTGFYITLRPEPLIALCLTVIISLVILGSKVSTNLSNLLILTTMGIAIAIHQSGTTVVTSGLSLLVINNFNSIRKKQASYYGLIWGLNVFMFAIFWNNSPKKIIRGLDSYNEIDLIYPGSTSITSNPLNEYERIFSVFTPGVIPNLQVWIILMLFLVISWFTIYILLNTSEKFTKIEIKLMLVLTSAFLGLIFATSKWASYYGVFIASYVVILSFVIRKNTKFKNRIFLFFAFIIFYYSFGRSWSSTIFEVPLRTRISISVDNFLSNYASALILATISVILFALIALRNKLLSLTLFNLTLIFTFTFNPTLDALNADKGWTFVSQSIKGLLKDPMSCGLAYDTKMHDDPNLSIQEFVTLNSASATLTPGDFFYSPCLTPISTKGGRWEMPDISIGVQVYDQQRLLLNTEKVELGCNSILLENSQLVEEEFCFYKVSTTIPDLNLSKTRKYSY